MALSRSLSKYAAIGALVYLVTGGALAQEDAEPALEEVTVTGSRIARRDFVANSPVVTVSRESLDATGAATIETALNQLPQFGLGGSSSSAGFSGTGLATLNLRGLGASRNLVLVDGHRVQPSTILQAVDVNTVPKSLIENVEIISGGASAVYGSDAISGVVNIKTIPRFEGIRFDSQYSFLENGEGGETTELGVTLGSNFLDERGNAVLALSWTDREEVPFQSLEFFRQAQGGTDFRLPTGIYSPGRSTPSQAAVDQVFAQYGAAPGRVPAGSRIGFNDDGTTFSASNGPLNYRGPSTLLFDTGSQLNNLNQFSIVQVPLERYAAFGRGSFELAPSVTAFARVNYSTHETLTLAEAGNNAMTIPVTHPFIPGDLATLLASRADPTAPFVLDKRYQEAGPRTFNRDFDVYQLAAGLTGKAGGLASSWEVFASRGSTELLETNEGSVLISSLTALINAADGGAGICAGGYNPFGMGTLSDSCRSFLVGTPKSRTTIDQDIVEANLQGALAQLPAGPLRYATGVGYRRDSYGFTPDPVLAQGDVVGVFRTEASTGETDVREAYVELLAPILSDLTLVKELEVGIAYRFSDYDTAGGVDAYKADLNWKLTNAFGLRGGYQRAVRAPSIGELYVAPSVTIPGIGNVATGGGDPCNFRSQARSGADAAAVRALCLAQGVPAAIVDTFDNLQNEVLATNIGNTALDPETADTYTFGLVFSTAPERRFLSRLSLAIDYYDIQLEGAIAGITAPQSIPRCFNRDGSSNPAFAADNFFCSLITRDPVTGVFADINQPTLNVGAYQTSGVDLQANWAFGLGAGAVNVFTAVTYLESFRIQTQAGGAFAEFADTVGSPAANQPGSLPRWKALTSFGYDGVAASAGVRWRYVDAMRDASLATNPASTAPGVETWNVFDVYARRNLTEALQVNGGVNNVADRDPPIVRGQPGTTEQSTYDIFGRTYYVALTAQF